MSSMDTARDTTRAVKTTVQAAGAFFFAPPTVARGAELGLDGITLYVAGRGGVLGDVDDDTLVRAFHHFTPGVLLPLWESGRKVAPPARIGELYADCARAWGREHLAELPEVARLAEITTRIVRANDLGAHAPLYSAWRGVPLPDDAPARLAQNLQTLREQRGGLHIVALTAHRLSPVEAQVAEAGPYLEFYGHKKPFPEVTEHLAARRRAAEELTDELVAACYAVLDEAEAADFTALTSALAARLAH
ncbi:SCO6745 family protein [Embleya sp. AB8]|uniref:SCO6745 family protein n=1 Tax=Embleya sp. AB8 TaxID=3156304 RepID=UPI003C793766